MERFFLNSLIRSEGNYTSDFKQKNEQGAVVGPIE